MCSVLEVSRSGFYAWLARGEACRSRDDRRLLARVREEHGLSRGTYGARRIHAALRRRGERCGLHRVERLMRVAGIHSKVRRKFTKTTDSNHLQPLAVDLLGQAFKTSGPNRVWVSDITYIATDEGWLYLASTLDLYSRRVVGWAMSASLSTAIVVDALEMALRRRSSSPGLVHHSDRGVQYAAQAFRGLLERNGIHCSMSRKGNCYDNALKESFFHTLKTELCDHEHYRSRDQARASVFEYIEVFYNRTRLHSALGYLSPEEFEQRVAD
jgi:transposase InsO family protein